MNRDEAKRKISELIGKDLRVLAETYGVTVFKDNKKNKGWAGHVIERHLNLPINSAQAPNFGSWELKTISLKYLKNRELTVKETMAITMIDPVNIERTDFLNSHLKNKLNKILIAARIWTSKNEDSSILYAVTEFDLTDRIIYNQIEEDYNLVRQTLLSKGFEALTGRMGIYIQPRTKGAGHGSTSRAFYARVPFLKKVIFPNL
ncbi:MAG: MutH/Sau3AI family endonuclease [candidate division Zixibacteria bacterium]|nr:MutH/Sau3AI family endonuclease [candidate division Zixibacteria bacterium]MDD5425576.1 MutH/Sau3AI family endonuclease [candidate division Zixibacteria bacterium]